MTELRETAERERQPVEIDTVDPLAPRPFPLSPPG
jgi:hypothetical protein